jgi:hypothetical protein
MKGKSAETGARPGAALFRREAAAAFLLAAFLCGAHAAGLENESNTYPASPYNGLQLTYQISGARITKTVEDDNWTRTLTFTGTLERGTLRVAGEARRSGGWNPPTVSATLQVTVEVDGETKTANAELLRDSAAPFDVAVPIPQGAKKGRIVVELVGIYNVGTRNVKLIGHFERDAASGGEGGGGEKKPPEDEVVTPKKKAPKPPEPVPPGAAGLSGKISGCQRDPFGRASGPDLSLPGAVVIAGQGIDFETGLTGEDVVKNADLIAGMTTTDARGEYRLDIPPGVYRVIIWRRHYVPQIDSRVTAPGVHNSSICDNIDRPATHESLRFSPDRQRSSDFGPEQRFPEWDKRDSGFIVSYPRILQFKGGDYSYIARHEGVLIRRNTDGKEAVVAADASSHEVAARFKNALERDGGLADQLGKALSGDVRAFDGALYIQVFQGGALVHEVSSGVVWISRHGRRRQ